MIFYIIKSLVLRFKKFLLRGTFPLKGDIKMYQIAHYQRDELISVCQAENIKEGIKKMVLSHFETADPFKDDIVLFYKNRIKLYSFPFEEVHNQKINDLLSAEQLVHDICSNTTIMERLYHLERNGQFITLKTPDFDSWSTKEIKQRADMFEKSFEDLFPNEEDEKDEDL